MKVVHLCLSSVYIDNYSYQENMLPKYHALQGHDVTVIASLVSFDNSGKLCLLDKESKVNTKDGFKVIRINYKEPLYSLHKFIRVYNETYKTLEKEVPDLIFIHDFSFIDIKEVIKYLKKHPRVKVFVDCHTDYINSAKNWFSRHLFHHVVWRYYARILSPYVEKFYGVTPLRCDFLKDAYHINPKKIDLLLMGVDDQLLGTFDIEKIKTQLFEELNISRSDFIITTGGKIDEKKNIHLVMEAIQDLSPKEVKLIVFGNVVPEMLTYFNTLLKSVNIIYVGWLSPEDIIRYFLISNLIVFPGTHSVLWEQAVGMGIPCVFKYWKGMTHVDIGGNCKFLYQDAVEEIKEILSSIINETDIYSEMIKSAKREDLHQFLYSEISRKAIQW